MKRAFDLLLAAAGLMVFAPVALVIAAAIKIQDGGPVLFAQDRVGRYGRVFRAWKFRSMVPDAERQTGAIQAAADDPRITRVGRWLRATAMDELPQLWNILRGQMSFVGPRPLRPAEQDRSAAGVVPLSQIPGYEQRHHVRPGLTGLAQVRAPRDASRDAKFQLDLEYVARTSLWLDLRLILESVWITVRARWGLVGAPESRGASRRL